MDNRRVVIVTGVSSFIGTYLAQAFAGDDYRVIGTHSSDLARYEGIRAARLDHALGAGVELIRLDLNEPGMAADLIRTKQPSVWVHHAAWATAYASLDYDLDRAHVVNVSPLHSIFEAMAEVGTGCLLTGSSMEYSNVDGPCKEQDPCWPVTPYGVAKLTATLRASQLANQFAVPTRAARIFIPFGPLDAPNKILPTVLMALRDGFKVDLSACLQVRDFTHVKDLGAAYLLLARDLERDPVFDLFNLCSGVPARLRELLLTIAETMGASEELLNFGARPMRPGDPEVSYGANGKAAAILGWEPRPLKQAVASYIETEVEAGQ